MTALATWRGDGLVQLAELEHVHARISGPARGRRWGTTQLNRSLFVALCARFQTFCRDLHDDAVGVHVRVASPVHRDIVEALLRLDRKLDTGNPRRSALGSDFGRLGVALVAQLRQRGPRTQRRLDMLDALVSYRNAVGHGDDAVISRIESAGEIMPTKASYLQYRRALDGLAGTMSVVVSEHLRVSLGVARPW